MLPEYDFRGGIRGKYARRFAKASNIVLLDPDVAKHFPTTASVNKALRDVIGGRSRSNGQATKRRRAG